MWTCYVLIQWFRPDNNLFFEFYRFYSWTIVPTHWWVMKWTEEFLEGRRNVSQQVYLKLRKTSCFNNKVTFFMYNKQQYESSKFIRFSQWREINNKNAPMACAHLVLRELLLYMCHRGDDSGANKSVVHGWNFNWPGQLHYISNSEESSPVCTHDVRHSPHVTIAASSWDFWPLWWPHTSVWRPDFVPRSPWGCSCILWGMWVQVSRAKRSCRFPARGKFALEVYVHIYLQSLKEICI